MRLYDTRYGTGQRSQRLSKGVVGLSASMRCGETCRPLCIYTSEGGLLLFEVRAESFEGLFLGALGVAKFSLS